MGSRGSRALVALVATAVLGGCAAQGIAAPPVPGPEVPTTGDPTVTGTTPPNPEPGRPGMRWVALGDSYSAGVGVPGTGGCGDGFPEAAFGAATAWRFAQAWPDPVSDVTIASCGGATVSDVTGTADGTTPSGGPAPDSQLSWAVGADVATMTIGGNDVGFSEFGIECFVPTPSNGRGGDCPDLSGPDPDALYDLMKVDRSAPRDPEGVWHVLQRRLTNAYVAINSVMADDGNLFVLTYPIPFALDHLTDSCGQSLSGLVAVALSDVLTSLNPFAMASEAMTFFLGPVQGAFFAHFADNARRANIFSQRLNETIVSAVRDANEVIDGPDRVHLVDWRTHYGPPQLRAVPVGGTTRLVADNPAGVCQSTSPPDVNFISVNLGDERNVNDAKFSFAGDSFHPTPAGYQTVLGELLAALEIIYPYDGTAAADRGPSPGRPATCVVKPVADREVAFPTCEHRT